MVRALIALVMGLTVMMPGIPMTTSQWLGRVSSMGANTDSEQSKVHEIKRDTGITQTLVEYEPTVRPAVNDTTMENRVIPVEDTKQADEPADGGYTEEDGWTVNEATVTYQSGDTYAFDDGSHENKVKYRSAWKGNPETKYAHTRNVNNDGVQSGTYGDNVVSTQVVTIPNATSLNVSLTYQTENNSYDWVCAYQGVGGEESCAASLTGKLGGTSKQTKEFTVDGDTVTFWFRTDGSMDNYYGYHATVTGESMIVHNTILDGTVRTPVIPEDGSGNAFLGWKPNPETMPIMGGMTTEAVYGQWREWGTCLWNVDEDGVLRIRPKSGDSGELGSTNGRVNGAPWYGRNVTRIESQGTIILNQDSSYLFYGQKFLASLSGLANWDVSRVTSMNYMFSNCSSLSDLSALAAWDVSHVTSMGAMFSNCTSLSDLSGLAAWDVSHVTDMRSLFSRCSSLSDLSGLANWDVSKVTDMGAMFYNCTSLSDLSALAAWDVSKVTDMSYLFSRCSSLSDLSALAKWDVSHVTNMSGLFSNCMRLSDVSAIAHWNLSSIPNGSTYWNQMFYNCGNLTRIGVPASQLGGDSFIHWNATDFSNAMPQFIEETGDRQYNSWDSLYHAMGETPAGYQQGIVYVKYTPSWIVNFDANGGIGTQTRMLVPIEDLSVELPSCEFMRFGYRFAGWTAQPDPISDMNPVLTTLTPATHNDGDRYTVYAQWEKLGDADEQPSTPASGMLPGWIQIGAENTSSIITPLQTGTTTFTNQYAPGSTSIVFKFTKLMDGNVPDQSYEFELLDQNGHVLQTVRNIGSTVAFQPINYTAEGEHVYLVREKNPNNDKIQYDDHLVQISVKVTGEGEQLKAEAIILGDTVFRNTSTPAVLSISKSVEHADQYTPDKDTQFTFDVELTDRDGKPVNGDYNMSIGDHAQTVTFKDGKLNLTLKAGQTATIKDIPAHAKYKVSETNLPDGYTLKDNALVNANGTLDANATVTVTAVNKYEPKNGAAMVQAVKKLLYANTDTAYVLKADQFRFTLCEVRPTDADPDNCVGVADTTNLKDGTVTFPQLEYDQPGTHTYQMREVIGVDSGITYDKQIVTVTVNVTDNGSGRLQTTVNYRNGTEPTFVNRIWNAPLLPQTGNVTVWALCATILLGGVFLAVQRGKRG